MRTHILKFLGKRTSKSSCVTSIPAQRDTLGDETPQTLLNTINSTTG
jgi:hypothetical protein